MKQVVYVASFSGPSDDAYVEVFKTRKEASTFLKKMYQKHFSPIDGDPTFQEWKGYGPHCCRVWKKTIK